LKAKLIAAAKEFFNVFGGESVEEGLTHAESR